MYLLFLFLKILVNANGPCKWSVGYHVFSRLPLVDPEEREGANVRSTGARPALFRNATRRLDSGHPPPYEYTQTNAKRLAWAHLKEGATLYVCILLVWIFVRLLVVAHIPQAAAAAAFFDSLSLCVCLFVCVWALTTPPYKNQSSAAVPAQSTTWLVQASSHFAAAKQQEQRASRGLSSLCLTSKSTTHQSS